MLIRRSADIPASEITDERLYLSRREFLSLAAGAVAAAAACSGGEAAQAALPNIKTYPPGPFHTDEARNPFEDITTYNNFYEFGSAKSDPAQHSGRFRPAPWTVKVDGHVAKPAEYQLEDLIRPHQLEERVYRLRCVEAWSMVIPWVGIPLADVIKRFEPTSKAKFVAFTTVLRPSEMPGQRSNILGSGLQWPYVEGLRMDEALHPLTILAVGLYGKTLLNQNGAPIRLVVPWKYGFKSIKSIVQIRFVEREPPTAWSRQAPEEYGFYSNVNPEVDHPRWSQKTERRLGEFRRRKTLMFNGYADQVASLYAGMNLRTNY